MQKTTKQHFEVFKKACNKWIKLYGLQDYAVTVAHEKSDGVYAHCFPDEDTRVCLIILATEWDNYRPLSNTELEICARHEVHHLLLNTLVESGQRRYSSKDEIERAEHAVIRRLDNMLEQLRGK
jgi:hypothetical protein